MQKQTENRTISLLLLVTMFGLGLALTGPGLLAQDKKQGQRKMPPSTMVDGYPMYEVLPKDGIPAIDNPEFVTANEGDAFMQDQEPVLGIFLNGEAKAYSLWTLDGHEIVNDFIGETPIAATW